MCRRCVCLLWHGTRRRFDHRGLRSIGLWRGQRHLRLQFLGMDAYGTILHVRSHLYLRRGSPWRSRNRDCLWPNLLRNGLRPLRLQCLRLDHDHPILRAVAGSAPPTGLVNSKRRNDRFNR